MMLGGFLLVSRRIVLRFERRKCAKVGEELSVFLAILAPCRFNIWPFLVDPGATKVVVSEALARGGTPMHRDAR